MQQYGPTTEVTFYSTAPPQFQYFATPKTIPECVKWLQSKSYQMIRGSATAPSQHTQVVSFKPQVHCGYDAFWLRDFCYMIAGNMEAFSAHELKSAAHLFVKSQRHDGAMVDCVRFDGTPIYKPGYGSMGTHPVADGSQFTVHVVYRIAKHLKDVHLIKNTVDALIRGMQAVPKNPDTGLVYIAPHGWDRCPYGFTDQIHKQGDQLFDSLLYVEACRYLSEMLDMIGRKQEAEQWKSVEQLVTAQINKTMWMPETHLYRAATLKCNQPDIWGSAYAVWLGVASQEQALQIATYFKDNYKGLVMKGFVRHLPPQVFWQDSKAQPGHYQNGAYWAVAAGWFAYCLDLVDSQLADQTILDMVHEFIASNDVNEWINGTLRGQPHYVASASLPLEGIRAMLQRRASKN